MSVVVSPSNPPEPVSPHALELAALEPIFETYQNAARGSLIPVLQAAQETYGYLSTTVLETIASRLNFPISQIYGVVTFYSQFRLAPRGKHVIRACQGTACHVRDSSLVLETLKSALGVTPGGTTADLQFTLETVACIGACSLAPVMMIDNEAHGRLRPDRVRAILDKYRG
ncbi:MAG: NADH-quinone oxidoreductase subunit NuoE [Deltaproteobacteria bacterium]|jgi:NADH:ubiquinone oxidoreductase subunit E|nr:NADH-quinone oxidoreductase subunit NuoE [Deltaproteobacteria bacterium]